MLFLTVGCQEPQRGAPRYLVSAKVLVNGGPAEGAFVRLFATDSDLAGKDREAYGVADAEGVVKFGVYEKGDGVPAGDFVATVSWPFEQVFSSPDKLRKKYSRQQDSEIRITVTPETTELEPIELTVPADWLTTRPRRGGA